MMVLFLLFIITGVSLSFGASAGKNGDPHSGGSISRSACYPPTDVCFTLEIQEVDFDEAGAACRTRDGGMLATVDSPEVSNFLSSDVYDGESPFWIGLHRSSLDSSVFVWADNSEASWNNWHNSSPSNKNTNKDCVAVISNSQWRTEKCTDTKPYLCQYERFGSNRQRHNQDDEGVTQNSAIDSKGTLTEHTISSKDHSMDDTFFDSITTVTQQASTDAAKQHSTSPSTTYAHYDSTTTDHISTGIDKQHQTSIGVDIDDQSITTGQTFTTMLEQQKIITESNSDKNQGNGNSNGGNGNSNGNNVKDLLGYRNGRGTGHGSVCDPDGTCDSRGEKSRGALFSIDKKKRQKVLINHVIDTVCCGTIVCCASHCLQQADCLSYNYQIEGQGLLRECQMNNDVLDGSSISNKDIDVLPGFQYFELPLMGT